MTTTGGEAGIVENLVTQFSNALDCFRELVQNAIDAGSPQVEVWTEYERGDGHQGVISLHVDDFGEGMDEQVIDSQFTRLFASAKENDLTKIGKFGIGFVSVFALRPRAVLVHTGRGGEYWEVLFHEDRSFSKTRLELPVEGTQLTIFLEGDYHRYRELTRGIRDALKHWCCHSENEITFEDRSPPDGAWSEPEVINEAFVVEGDCLTSVEHQGTTIVLAYHDRPTYGFYNRGLTLARSTIAENVLDHRATRYQHVTFKMKSRYLEHTLSRETVLRDESYEKAMLLLDRAADDVLLRKLADAIEAVVREPVWTYREVNRYIRLMSFLSSEPRGSLERVADRALFRDVDGAPMSMAQLLDVWRDHRRLLVTDTTSDMTRQLRERGERIVYGMPTDSRRAVGELSVVMWIFATFAAAREVRSIRKKLHNAARQLTLRGPGEGIFQEIVGSITAPESVYLPVAVDHTPPEDAQLLLRDAHRLLREAKVGYRRLTSCRLIAPTDDAPLFVVAPRLSPLMERPPPPRPRRTAASPFGAAMRRVGDAVERVEEAMRPLEAAVNLDHPQVRTLRRLWATSPNIAAYCLAKDLLLSEDRLLERDLDLIAAAHPGAAR